MILAIVVLVWGGLSPEGNKHRLPYFSEAEFFEKTISSNDDAVLGVKVRNPENYYKKGTVDIQIINETPYIYISRGETISENSIKYTIQRDFMAGGESGWFCFQVRGSLPKGVTSQTVEIKAQVLVENIVTDEQILHLTIKKPK